jgi:hypothetical protein
MSIRGTMEREEYGSVLHLDALANEPS